MVDTPGAHVTDDFDTAAARITGRFAERVDSGHVYTTDAEDLFDVFLAALPPEPRQFLTCSACRRFVNRYGGLAAIDDQGRHASALWNGEDSRDAGLAVALEAMADVVRRARVTGVFISDTEVLGTPTAGGWPHFSAPMPRVHSGLLNAGQVMAAKREDFQMLVRGLEEFDLATVQQAHSLLQSGNLFRSVKCIGVAKWLLELHQARQGVSAQSRANITWVAVADAPAGFCHVRSGMIGTLLEDIVAGLPFATIKARFDAKMDPTRYLRPTAAPSDGNIAQAEKIVAQLETEGALLRRFAQLEEIEAVWRPEPLVDQPKPKGVFGHLRSKRSSPKGIEQPDVTMTWDKFSRTVLPEAAKIEYFVGPERAAYVAIVTASDEVSGRMEPTRNKSRIFRVFRFLSGVKAEGQTDLETACRTFVAQHKRRGLAVLISDLYDPAGFEK
nr:hypothetical protein [Deltaproteobacteria bacterium]